MRIMNEPYYQLSLTINNLYTSDHAMDVKISARGLGAHKKWSEGYTLGTPELNL